MEQETLTVEQYRSGLVKGLVISVRSVTRADDCHLVVGRPGQPNVTQKGMTAGDAVLYETPEGLFEIRVLALNYGTSSAQFLVTQVSPRGGILAGVIDDRQVGNEAFTPAELGKIAVSFTQINVSLSARDDLTQEQLALISRKLDEMRQAAERLGRKDWVNYAMGTLTSLFITAAFAPEQTRAILVAFKSAFSWLLPGSLLLLGA